MVACAREACLSTRASVHVAFPSPLTAFDPAGTAGDVDGVVWRAEAGGGWHGERRHRGPVLAVAGDASAGADGRVVAGEGVLAVHAGPATALARIGGRVWSAGGDGRVWAGDRFVQAHDGAVAALVPHGDGALTAGVDGRVVAVVGTEVRERVRAGVAIDALAAHGDTFAAGLADGTLLVHGPDGPRTERLAEVPVFFVARGVDGWVAATIDGRVHAKGRSFETGADGVFPVALDPDGRRVWVAVGSGVRAWDLVTGAPVGVLAPPDAIGLAARGLAVDGSGVWAWDRSLARWSRPEPIATADHAAWVRGLIRVGGAVISWANDGCVIVRGPDLALGRVIVAHAGPVWSVAASPDGTRLATGGEREVATWSLATGACLGRWSVSGRAVAWRGDELLAGGADVRLAVLGPDGAVVVRGRAGPGFAEQTQRILVEPDGAVVTGSTVGTAGWRFPREGGAPSEATLPPASNVVAALEGVSGSRYGEVGPAPADLGCPPAPVAKVAAPPPRWPPELGPDWLRGFLADATRRPRSRAALHATLLRDGVVAPAAVLAWEAAIGGWRAAGLTVGAEARSPGVEAVGVVLPTGVEGLLVAADWPSRFYGDAAGVAWELRLGRWSQVGPLPALLPLLALRRATGAPLATVEVGPGRGEALALALGAAPIDLGTTERWWLGAGARVDEGAGGTRAVVAEVAALVAAVRAVVGDGPTVTAAAPKVVEAPLAEAPAGEGGLALDPGRKPGLVQRVAVGGRVVEELVIRGKVAKATRWVRVTGAEPAALSAPARAWLAAHHARRDPRDTAPADALRDRLRERGYAVHEAVVAAEAVVGGLRFPDPPSPDEPWIAVGAWQYLGLWPHGWSLGPDARAAGAVPLAYGPGDGVWVVYPDGRVGWWEAVAMAAPVVVGAAVLPWLERLIRAAGAPAPLAERPGRQGAALAEVLGCVPVPEASDPVEGWWTGDGVDVSEEVDLQAAMDGSEEPGTITRVRAAKAAAKRCRATLR